ncbi:MAG: aminodeoxychorismate/anthranilate synthase component II [Deltaproteobacteria bacterium]|nr:aminodeoxychorismate/anthranilate synthase component II [Deltaproteobacteria bacterium]
MILLIDNYDSFTYNIAHALGSLGQEVRVFRNDALTPAEVENLSPEAIVISPGPGRPADAGISCEVIERLKGRAPILGVCLGHQCIAEVFGAQVVRARRPVHGKTSAVFHDGRTIYTGLRNPFLAARYHSLVVPEESLPPLLEVSAYTQEGEVMGLRCAEFKVEGVQIHPESIATPQGPMIFRNFIDHYLGLRLAA